ncbi:hypothetical protein BBM24_21890 [Vibrio parahaemolyticus]|nr:hypothetical protein [Vibrio parahaemolyticus]EGR0744807.1 hypothetical protein [Vibrio parahaemolyticus]EGR1177293.1 hypothetical protein [Vibrio parahaemolyticus]EGR2226562.1 hypothetical protein [Vibrio parahaemolyticus]EGR3029637.1 hypothetical protein [Vibrio parahaemolyticus]EIF2840724.1 hypothetical protein [Vibrio parahaemolyticus]
MVKIMNVLFIEDDKEKIQAIKNHMLEKYSKLNFYFEIRESVQSGLDALISDKKYDLLLLDMALPNYNISNFEPDGGSPESFGGRDLLFQMKMRRKDIPSIVITQFESFGDDNMTLNELKNILSSNFSDIYLGTVYFSITSDEWKKDLDLELMKVIE